MRPEAVLSGNDHTEGAFPGMAGVKVETTAEGRSLNALYRHPQRTRLDPYHPLRSMEKARAAVVNAGASMSRPAMMGRDRDWMCAGRGILPRREAGQAPAPRRAACAHWNVAGPNFIAMHEMLDPQVDEVLAMADETAERIAALGGSPSGRPDDIVRFRTWGQVRP